MSHPNIAAFISNQIINCAEDLTDAEHSFLEALTAAEVQQLIDMWVRLDRPALPSDRNVVGFF